MIPSTHVVGRERTDSHRLSSSLFKCIMTYADVWGPSQMHEQEAVFFSYSAWPRVSCHQRATSGRQKLAPPGDREPRPRGSRACLLQVGWCTPTSLAAPLAKLDAPPREDACFWKFHLARVLQPLSILRVSWISITVLN